MKTNAWSDYAPPDVVFAPKHRARRKHGGQPGNRNALRTGSHVADMRALRRGVAPGDADNNARRTRLARSKRKDGSFAAALSKA
ncbi:MAG: hypothetical protein ACREHE_12800 [Rhizomicrobium sp.]